MTDPEATSVPPVPISEHSRVLIAMDEAAAFDRVLVEHLDREEAVVVPPFESMLSEADQHPSRSRRPSWPPTGTWVLANATAEEAASLRATAPRLLGVIQDRVWEPRVARLLAPLYNQPTQP